MTTIGGAECEFDLFFLCGEEEEGVVNECSGGEGEQFVSDHIFSINK